MGASIWFTFENENVVEEAADIIDDFFRSIDEEFEAVDVGDDTVEIEDIEVDEDEYADVIKTACICLAKEISTSNFKAEFRCDESFAGDVKYARANYENNKLTVEIVEIDHCECPNCGSVCWGYEDWSQGELIRCEDCMKKFDANEVFGDGIKYNKDIYEEI